MSGLVSRCRGIFHVVELHQSAKGKLQLVGMHDMEDRHVMALEAQVLQARHQIVHIAETVRDQKNQAASPRLLRQVMQERCNAGLVRGLGAFQGFQNGQHVPRLAADRQLRAASAVKNRQAGAVALMNNRISEDGRKQLGIFQLVGRAVAVEHRAAGVEQNMADEVRFLLVLLDGVAFRPAVAFPVDVANIVAGHIFAVLDEFDGEAAEGAFVIADAQSLDDGASLQAEGLCFRDHIRRQICGGQNGVRLAATAQRNACRR